MILIWPPKEAHIAQHMLLIKAEHKWNVLYSI